MKQQPFRLWHLFRTKLLALLNSFLHTDLLDHARWAQSLGRAGQQEQPQPGKAGAVPRPEPQAGLTTRGCTAHASLAESTCRYPIPSTLLRSSQADVPHHRFDAAAAQPAASSSVTDPPRSSLGSELNAPSIPLPQLPPPPWAAGCPPVLLPRHPARPSSGQGCRCQVNEERALKSLIFFRICRLE